MVGLILSIIAYGIAKEVRDPRSRNLSGAGIIVSVVFLALELIVVTLGVLVLFSAGSGIPMWFG